MFGSGSGTQVTIATARAVLCSIWGNPPCIIRCNYRIASSPWLFVCKQSVPPLYKSLNRAWYASDPRFFSFLFSFRIYILDPKFYTNFVERFSPLGWALLILAEIGIAMFQATALGPLKNPVSRYLGSLRWRMLIRSAHQTRAQT